MCTTGSTAAPASAPAIASAAAPAPAPYCSRRRLLWELDGHAHCPVVGVCLPFDAVRRLAGKALRKAAAMDDYTLHCHVVSDCKRRTPMAEAVKRDLDARYAREIAQAARLKSPEALAAWWGELAQGKDLAGAFWAALTHSCCTPELERKVLGEVHMMQHQVGATRRAGLQRLEVLAEENAGLARAAADARQRASQQADEHALREGSLRLETGRLRERLAAGEMALARLEARLAEADAALRDRRGGERPDGEAAMQAARIRQLERELQQSRREEERHRLRAEALAQRGESRPPPTPCGTRPAGGDGARLERLRDLAVLCVGGRTASVPQYRQLVESTGGRFLHHDGGDEHCVSRLDATLAAADLVICQAGCISHDAYWRVKDHCKRTGKRCVFVENPGITGLRRALGAIGTGDARAGAASAPGS